MVPSTKICYRMKSHWMFILLAASINIGCKDSAARNEGIISGGVEQDSASRSPAIEVVQGIAEVNGALIEYFDQGTGEAIILLSGRGLDVGYLAPLANSLSESGFRAIRVNRRGAGNSTGNLIDLTYHTHASDVKGVLDHLGIPRSTILGHALGNRIARIFAADFPETTISVILMPASGKVEPSEEEQQATGKMFSPGASQDEIMYGMTYMVGDPSDSERIWEIIKGSSMTDPAALQSEVSTTSPLEEWWAPEGRVPYLVLHGTEDKSAPIENAYLLQQDLGDRMTLVTLEGLGHLAPVEDPDQVAMVILKHYGN